MAIERDIVVVQHVSGGAIHESRILDVSSLERRNEGGEGVAVGAGQFPIDERDHGVLRTGDHHAKTIGDAGLGDRLGFRRDILQRQAGHETSEFGGERGHQGLLGVAGTISLSIPNRKEWYLASQGLNLKRYPICYATHRAIDGALDLALRHDLKPDDVGQIRVATGQMQMLMLRNDRPKTAFEAKFSMQFAMAASLVARNVGLAQLTDQFVTRPAVQSLIPRVSITTTTETMNGSAFAPSESVEITTVNGKTFTSEAIVHAKGSMQRPLSPSELEDKFLDCVGDQLADNAKTNTFEKLMNLERLNGASDLLSLQ